MLDTTTTEDATSYAAAVGAEQATNALRFATREDAARYLSELTGRWLGAPYPHVVIGTTDAPTHTADADGRAHAIA